MTDPLPPDESPSVVLQVAKRQRDRWLGVGVFLLAVSSFFATVGLLISSHQANDRAVASRRLNIEVIQKLADQTETSSCRAASVVVVNQAQAELTVAIADTLVALRGNRPEVPGLLAQIDKASHDLTLAVAAQRAALINC